MDQFIDNLSRQLVSAVSRRDLLRISIRAMFTAFVASNPLIKSWATGTGILGGTVGSSSCRAVQKSIQIAFADRSGDSNHGQYISAIARSASVAQNANIITDACSSCIVDQFARKIPIVQQQTCGVLVPPTQSCQATSLTATQVQAAAVLTLNAFPDALSRGTDFEGLIALANAMLGCQLNGAGPQQSATSMARQSIVFATSVSSTTVTPTCITQGANYCGPGNSLERWLPTVAPCLNGSCFEHDNCYGEHCVVGSCYWTAQTTNCDNALLATCHGSGGCTSSELLNPATFIETTLVCTLVNCLMGIPLLDPNLSAICLAQRNARNINPECNGPLRQCLDCKGSSPCGNCATGPCECCPCGHSCVNGSCQCLTEQTTCGTQCCDPASTCCSGTLDVLPFCCASGVCCGATCCPNGETCCGGKCCPVGQCCGSTCCPSGDACSNGTCVDCEAICGSQVHCCAVTTFEVPCCPSGYTCCPSLDGTALACVPPGYVCCAALSVAVACDPTSSICCADPHGANAVCCPLGSSCGPDFGSCV